jgi:hypothetical protein
MNSFDINHAALFDHKKGIAARLGKSDEYVRRECHPADDGHLHDRYGRFKQLFLAVLAENPPGADLYLEDLTAAREAARRDINLTDEEWEQAVDEAIKETSEGIRAAVKHHDPAEIHVQVSEGISRLRLLLAINHVAGKTQEESRA